MNLIENIAGVAVRLLVWPVVEALGKKACDSLFHDWDLPDDMPDDLWAAEHLAKAEEEREVWEPGELDEINTTAKEFDAMWEEGIPVDLRCDTCDRLISCTYCVPDNVIVERQYTGDCEKCGEWCRWISCPTGGWWSHVKRPDDSHAADISWTPPEEMNDDGYWETM